jgi:hypothetical protein
MATGFQPLRTSEFCKTTPYSKILAKRERKSPPTAIKSAP